MGANGPNSPRALTRTAVTGSAMGLAELVPGFSAGTVAYVAGIYERFLGLIRAVLALPAHILRRDAKTGWRAIDWPFALTLLIAMFATVFAAAGAMRYLLDTFPETMSAIFFGLVLGAAVAAARQIGGVRLHETVAIVVVGALVFVLLGFAGGDTTTPPWWFVVLAGMIAISAWILPGVSGSFTLVVLGIYPVIVGAVADRDLLLLAVFAAGCVAGLALVVNLLTWLLARHDRPVRIVLIAVMLGSVRVLWPWSATFGAADLAPPPNFGAFLALTSVAIVSAAAVVWVAAHQPKTPPTSR